MLIDREHAHRVLVLSGASAFFAAISATATLGNIEIYDHVVPPELLLGTLGFDVVSLIAAVALVACLAAIERHHPRWWLVWVGLQSYLLYAYALYAFGAVYTPLYFCYLAVVGLSTFALAAFGRGVNPELLRRWPVVRLPRRTMGALLVVMAVGFSVSWSDMLLAAIGGHAQIAAATVLVLDLTFSLPLLVTVAWLLLRRRPVGDLLAPGVFALSAGVTLAVGVSELLRPAFGETFSLALAIPYLLPAALSAVFALVAFRRVGPSIQRA